MTGKPVLAALAVLTVLFLWPLSQARADSPVFVARFYFSPECGSCVRFVGSEVPRLEEALGVRIALELRDVMAPGVLQELQGLLAARGLELTILPVLVAGETVLVGSREIEARFEETARAFRSQSR